MGQEVAEHRGPGQRFHVAATSDHRFTSSGNVAVHMCAGVEPPLTLTSAQVRIWIDKQLDRYIDGWVGSSVDKQRGRETDRQTQTDRQTNRCQPPHTSPASILPKSSYLGNFRHHLVIVLAVCGVFVFCLASSSAVERH